MFQFSKKNYYINPKQRVFFDEDYPAEAFDESIVGRKGLSVIEARDMDVPVPAFFLISTKLFNEFLYSAFDDELEDLLKKKEAPTPEKLRKLLTSESFSRDFEDELSQAYSRLSGFSDSWVAVRSSVAYPDRPDLTFSGIFDTKLNVRGFENLRKAIKSVYGSIFTEKLINYARTNSIDLSKLEMGIVVERMVQAEVSGITYTMDPITHDRSKMSIEAVFGLGEVIANGEITPDLYILDKKELTFDEKHISPQEWMKVRKIDNNRTKEGSSIEKINLSNSWSYRQKLEDRFLQEVAKIALILEDKKGVPQNVEWVWESGQVWVIQNKNIEQLDSTTSNIKNDYDVESLFPSLLDIPARIVKKGKVENKAIKDALKLVRNSKDEEKDSSVSKDEDLKGSLDRDFVKQLEAFDKLVKERKFDEKKNYSKEETLRDLEVERQVTSAKSKGVDIKSDDAEREIVGTGKGGSFGVSTGVLIKFDGKTLPERPITRESILLIKNYVPTMLPLLSSSGGVIAEEGSLSGDLSILARESGVPLVFDIPGVYEKLVDGDKVSIDGGFGMVYRMIKNDERKIVDKVEPKKESPVTRVDAKEEVKLPEKEKSTTVESPDSKGEKIENVSKSPIKTFNREDYSYSVPSRKAKEMFSDMDKLMDLKKAIENKYAAKIEKNVRKSYEFDKDEEFIENLEPGRVAKKTDDSPTPTGNVEKSASSLPAGLEKYKDIKLSLIHI